MDSSTANIHPPLNSGVRRAIQILVTARKSPTTERTRAANALTTPLRNNDLDLDARKAAGKT